MFVRAKQLRQEANRAEGRLWYFIRNGQIAGFKFRRQVPFDIFFADFACHEARLIIEVDGDDHNFAKDPFRTAFLERIGYRVIRFSNEEVYEGIEGVLAAIRETLGLPDVDATHSEPLDWGETPADVAARRGKRRVLSLNPGGEDNFRLFGRQDELLSGT